MSGPCQDAPAESENSERAARWIRVLRIFFPLDRGDLARLLNASRHSIVFNHQRARFILRRIRLLASWLALLIPFWIPLDAIVFPHAVWQSLALGRIGTGLSLAILAAYCRRAVSLTQGFLALAVLFFIPSVFFLFSHTVISDASLSGIGAVVTSSYVFFPFVVMAGISIFPLAVMEIAVLGLLLLAVATIHVTAQHTFMTHILNAGGLWILGMVVVVAGLAAVSQLRLMHDLFAQSSIDSLTGVLNRRSGAELMALQFALACRYRYPLALVFMDLDDFKQINDAAGHEAGDKILVQTARSWHAALRESDSILRWGGEEFIVLLPHTDCIQAKRLVRNHKTALQRPDGKPLTCSIGIAERLADNATTIAQLVALADQRMYQAKTAGKARIVGCTLGHQPEEMK